MSTVSRGLPERPHLDVPKREAKELLASWRDREPQAVERVRKSHPKFHRVESTADAEIPFKLADAQLVLAREYGFPSWAALKKRIDHQGPAGAVQDAIGRGDAAAVVALLRGYPEMLHLPVWSGNWGPPMSHAANLGQLEVIKACAELGARDYQHAFDRALLQGKIDCARWLQAHGARATHESVMGCCETQNADGFRFLMELDAPLANAAGDRLAPLAAVLGTYGRRIAGKHAILDLLVQRGYTLPDTPIMALQRGDVARLDWHLEQQPGLLERTFSLREIYPPECGFTRDSEWGMHWTPIDGTTLLHLAIDFRERAVFDWLLVKGANPNARASVDAEGFGGHTPLFNAVVNGPWRDDHTIPTLLRAGGTCEARAHLRKFLDWRETPGWHIARDVTPREWANTFPDQGWVDAAALTHLPPS